MYVNQSDFDQPGHWRASLGSDIAIYVDSKGTQKRVGGNGGMIAPQRYQIPAGTTLFRYASQGQPRDVFLSSGWWMERAELDMVLSFARQNEVPEGYAVRMLAAVPIEWGSKLDMVVRARTLRPLLAFRGLANTAIGTLGDPKTRIEARNDVAAWRLNQLYIPGLRSADGKIANKHQGWLQLEETYPVRNAYTWIYRGAA